MSQNSEDKGPMDRTRQGVAGKRWRRRIITGVIVAAALTVVSIVISRLGPAAPGVDMDSLWIGEVERGPMLRQVRGHGTLVPVDIRWIPAATSGRVETILVEPGARVEAETTLMILSNPAVEQEALDAESALNRARAELESLRVQLLSEALNKQAEAAEVDAEYTQAQLQLEADRALAEDGLVAGITLKKSESVEKALAIRRDIEQQRLEMTALADTARLEAKEAEVDQHLALLSLRTEQLDSLRVQAGLAGVVQEIPVEVGQQVTPGTNLALVAEPSRLKAELRIPATQASELQNGQKVSIDTRYGDVPGLVRRIDPAVREGTVLADVELTGPLPRGARPEMRVEGTVEIEYLEDILYTGRPAVGGGGETVGLFRLEKDGDAALRVGVRLGRTSVNTIEILDGLNEGDRVILSDTSKWDDHERIRLK